MRKKLDTRFPATRIKKIMQADEEVGKIAMAVPLLVSKALELFLQDLCDRTYEITLERGVKTMNSFHLKQCVQSFNSFDFLKDTVNKVPDLGGSDGAAEDKPLIKKRKISEDEDGEDEEPRTILVHEAGHVSSNKRGRGRPRGRGRGRGSRMLERETIVHYNKPEEAGDSSDPNEEDQNDNPDNPARRDHTADTCSTNVKDEDKSIRNFDLNVDLNANGDSTSASATAPPDMKCDDIPGWSMERIGIDLGSLNGGMDEQDEDYDAE